MRIALATPLYPPEIGGPATYAKALCDGLPGKGIEVDLVKFSEVRHLPKIIRHAVYYRRVLKAARTADLVLALDPVSTGLPAMRAAQKADKPFVVKIVGDYAWEQGRQRFGITADLDGFVRTLQNNFFVRRLQTVQTRVARSAARVIVPSEYLKKIVMQWGIPAEKIEVIYNAVPDAPLGTVPSAVRALPKPLYVSIGRLVPWKGFDEVISTTQKTGASLVIVGDGPLRARLENRAARELGDRCVFTGQLSHEDTLAVMNFGDVFILNSSYEGLSHALIEAVRLGKPIVATNAGGNPEVVSGGLIPVGDNNALLRAVQTAQPAPESDAQKFSDTVMLSATAALFEKLT